MDEKAHPKKPHQYVTYVLNEKKYAKCAHPKCYHWVPILMAIGKMSLCNYCEREYILSRRAARMVTPHCGCRSLRQQKAEQTLEKVGDILERILPR